jgi:hypothetical protein
MPQVLNKRTGEPAGSVYVGRPTIWGNPFTIGKDGTRAEVVLKYSAWLNERPELKAKARAELRGKDLVCWCAPALCHAQVLLSVANR